MTLIEAITENNEEEVFRLLNLKTDSSGKKFIDEVDEKRGGSALYWAAFYGYVHFIGPLVQAGGDVNKPSKNGCTPVYIAAQNGHAIAITALKAAGANVDTPKGSLTPVYVAAQFGQASAITALHAAGANVNTLNTNGATPVYIAAERGHAAAITVLLEAGADASVETPFGTALERAKKGKEPGHAEVVKLLEAHLKQYPNGIKPVKAITKKDFPTKSFSSPEQKNSSESTLQSKATDLKTTVSLIEAITENNEEEVFRLLNLKVDPSGKKIIDEVDETCRGSALHWATVDGYFHFIDPLVKAGINVNKQDKDGRTPVYYAAVDGCVEAIRILKTAGANVNTPENEHGCTPVYIAAQFGQASAITALHAAGANVNTPENKYGYTPVCIAAVNGHAQAITALHAAGANVDTPNRNGETPVYVAAHQRQASAITALHAVGANVNTPGESGATPVYIAAFYGNAEAITALHVAGANVDTPNRNGETPVYVAAYRGKASAITALHAAGANVDTPNKYGHTPLYIAARDGHAAAITALHTAEANVNTSDKDGATPVYIAAFYGNAEAITALHTAGANVNTPENGDGMTPVYIAAQNGHAAAITALLEAGADASIKTQWGTALEQAKQGKEPGHAEIVKLLEAHLKQYPNGIKPVQATGKAAAKIPTSASVSPVNKEVKTVRDVPTEPKKPAQPQSPAASKSTANPLVSAATPVSNSTHSSERVQKTQGACDMFSSIQVNSGNKSNTDWRPILEGFEQQSPPVPEQGLLVSCQIDYNDLSLDKELGQGSFAIVYKGTYQFASVAIKKLQMGNLSPEAQEEFRKEAEIMAQLRHPNIVHFYGYCSIPKCLVMEYMPKGSLFNVLQDKQQALNWELRIRIAVDMASGLAFLHSKAILHRDIKSLNVLLDEQGKAKLTDFGLSKVKNEAKSLASTKNDQKSKELVGTLPWMAPELFAGEKYAYKSDIYSLGITFWELAARKIPYNECSQEAIPAFVSRGKREDIPQDCPKKLAYLIQQCWAGDPEARPTAAGIAKFMTTDAKTLEEASAFNLQVSPASPAAVPAVRIRRGSKELDFTDKKGEQEKLRYVLEELRTFFSEERDIGEKTENYDIYNEYLKKAHNNTRLVYKPTQNKHILYVNDEPLDADSAAKELSKMLKSLTAAQTPQKPRVLETPKPLLNNPALQRVFPPAPPAPKPNPPEQKTPPAMLSQFQAFTKPSPQVNASNVKAAASLIEAIKQNNQAEVSRLLTLKTDSFGKRFIDETDAEWKGSPLYWAADCGYAHFIDPLLKAGADIHKKDKDGRTPVYRAAQNGQASAITALHAAGANVNTAKEDGITPLSAAAGKGHALAVIALLEAGADASTKTKYGTALEQATKGKEGGHREVVRVIEAHLEAYPSGIKPRRGVLKGSKSFVI